MKLRATLLFVLTLVAVGCNCCCYDDPCNYDPCYADSCEECKTGQNGN